MLPPGTGWSKVHHRAQSAKAIPAAWHREGGDAMARQGVPALARAAARPSGFPAKGRPIVDIAQRAAIRHHPVSRPLLEPVPSLEVRPAISWGPPIQRRPKG